MSKLFNNRFLDTDDEPTVEDEEAAVDESPRYEDEPVDSKKPDNK
jgi:hypothetical protein